MEKLPPLGTGIGQVAGPTFGIYVPLLQANAAAIRSTKSQTYSYGALERQKLDVYHPATASSLNGRRPVLIFCYGGGLVRGDKILQGVGDGLVHANIASFFAQKYGYTVIIPDYRLMSHGAKFPSGGEDVSLVIEWICKNGIGQGPEPIDLFLMGNSAGGVHQSTFLLHPSFAETRQKVAAGSKVHLRGNILLSVPFDFKTAEQSRVETLTTYFGDVEANAPLGLLQTARKQHGGSNFLPGTRFLALNGDLDPENEILQPKENFLAEWSKIENSELRSAMKVEMMPGQNHISPCVSLGTGKVNDEAWGHQVGAFCDEVRKESS